MKPVAFAYARPASVGEAAQMLAAEPGAKVLAGGQTLGPLLNLRLAQPALLIDIARISELADVKEDAAGATIGATVTHAAIEDGRVPDPTGGFLAEVAHGIAYRAVRTRGTIGGSLAHADPAADWLSCLTALGAEVVTAGTRRNRRLPLADFVRSAMETALAPDELITGIRIAKVSRRTRFGFHKICRKTGEFADAIGVAVHDPERSSFRLVASTSTGKPIMIEGAAVGIDLGRSAAPTEAALRNALVTSGFEGDAYDVTLHAAALKRAIAGALAS